MKIKLILDYYAVWGQTVCVYGSLPELGNMNENDAQPMTCINTSQWVIELNVDSDVKKIEYGYLIRQGNETIRREWGKLHVIEIQSAKDITVFDLWSDKPTQNYLLTSGFSDSFFRQPFQTLPGTNYRDSIALTVFCPYINKNQELILCGESPLLGDWNADNAPRFITTSYAKWQLSLDASANERPLQYKLAIFDRTENRIIHWEEGSNRTLHPPVWNKDRESVRIENLVYLYPSIKWKAAGVAIPVFSLRSEDSFGIGEFSDLKKMVDWAAATNQKVIQILPINDTTITYSWTDSYPYNAISIYALHPIYLGVKEFPLRNNEKMTAYENEARALNLLPDLDYSNVMDMKNRYFQELFDETGRKTMMSEEYVRFYQKNEEWLFPYACFSFLRDENNTADYKQWQSHNRYDRESLKAAISSNPKFKEKVEKSFFIQYLLDKQLAEVKEYAHQNNVILKGDVPIGISRNSVEAWTEPHLFNLDTQTGAPPDDFSINGQNWGFPTYNWEEMAKDGYLWWTKRFRKMADYFDAYRIDHILGFFRIWEIPLTSVQGLLGYFNPALPLSLEEIHDAGLWLDDQRMTSPYITDESLDKIFGKLKDEVKRKYLHPTSSELFELNEECNTQAKIREIFKEIPDSNSIRDGLYSLCNEVLFIRDKREPDKYHPRITAQHSFSFQYLDDIQKNAFNNLYNDFFYRRHSHFWRNEAMKKLPALISSTSMLVCGEDLGMIPECVPSVMNELQILSLEIERMPKTGGVMFEPLASLPYLSVCTTSTHDMAPIRGWWKEESKDYRQKYYNDVLCQHGMAPDECNLDICNQIVRNHLNSPAMLAILPLQDWLSTSGQLRRKNEDEERINIPSEPRHYWRYRMHLTLEELLKADDFNLEIKSMIEDTGRG
ncbi:4-alpha-glucanotransferase [Dysgonomonas sp. 520]|uniref:4-alpha-glucanotransferase n=1 Tax=Dysgonomonas sp. 520 TaxID=2302931 RepID=UPI0013D8A7D4|nr:4-alpha-glucanotransferase [Dysgonomonas sp. 520]NDW10118.1 hypothetical protein [Dysgonomonas sp. 520]